MSCDLLSACKPLIERFQALAATDAEFRAQLRELGRAVAALIVEPEQQPAASGQPEAPGPPAPGESLADKLAPLLEAVSGHVGGAYLNAPSAPVPRTDKEENLTLLEDRLRLKAEGARWAATRQRWLRADVDYRTEIEPRDRDIIARAKALPECFLWMCHPDHPIPDDLSQYEILAGCFDAAALAVNLLRTLTDSSPRDTDTLAEAMLLAAEAQSALRVIVGFLNRNPDRDQLRLFHWLRNLAAKVKILIPRYMRQEDIADPVAWPERLERLRQLERKLKDLKDRDKARRSLFNRIRYHLKLIRANPERDHAHDWQTIARCVDELVAGGLPPSNVELRELLLPVIDDVPDFESVPKNFELVLREIDRYAASRPTRLEPLGGNERNNGEVREVAELLRGRALVMIGGDRRPYAEQALLDAFGLSELIWIETREHQTHAVFEPHVARPDVALVVLAIRWSSHGFGEVKSFCDKYNKPLVRLPAGYSPNQVAFHIVNQVGDRLRQSATLTESP
ncbi:MAG: hypothetical protein NZ700_14210 [Gemmataceae bacterium]|nr:hypothetical protein [Gemmataceae bacterium]MDW8264578.1 hypothetical protein [Gemmataceae bacterium]